MSGLEFDILIVVSEKDFNKLPFLWHSIHRNLSGFDKIYFISNVEIPNKYKHLSAYYYLDKEVIDFSLTKNLVYHSQ